MTIDPSAYLGTPEGYATKEQLAAAQALSQLLMKPQQPTMYHPIQGLSNIANAIIGGYFGRLADQRQIAKGKGEGAAGQIGVVGGGASPAFAQSQAAQSPEPNQDRVKTAALGDAATDAYPSGPPPFSRSIAEAVSPGIGVSGVQPTAGAADTGTQGMTATANPALQATLGALTGASPASSFAPVQTAQASGGSPVASSGGMGQVGTFVNPDYLPKRFGVTDQQMKQLEFMYRMGDMPLEEITKYRDLYMQSKQPMTMDTPFGTLSWSADNPSRQFLQPKIEEKAVEAGGVKAPMWIQQTPQGVVQRPMLTPQGPQGGASSSSGGFPYGNIQGMSDWANQQNASKKAQEKAVDAATAKEAEIDKGAANAVAVKSRLAEMRNLASGINPNDFADLKARYGNLLQGLGFSNKAVSDWLGTNPANYEAFNKVSTTLAAELGAQSFPRLTQYEFQTILKNATPGGKLTPEGLGRIMDFMDKQADQSLAKQQSWSAWKSNPNNKLTDWHNWETDWNKGQAALIKEGKLTSQPGTVGGPQSQRNAAPQIHSPADIEAEMRRRGLLK